MSIKIGAMVGSELSYVQEQLARSKRADWKVVSAATGIPFRTVTRIGYGEVRYPRSDTIGKLAIYFRRKRKAA